MLIDSEAVRQVLMIAGEEILVPEKGYADEVEAIRLRLQEH